MISFDDLYYEEWKMPLTREECFSILQLSSDASELEVKSAYKRLALKTHPDKNPDDPEANKKFLLVSEAYKRIVDPESFKHEDGDEGVSQEEMTEMFNFMFTQMFAQSSSGMNFFDAMETFIRFDNVCEEDDLYEEENDMFQNGMDPYIMAMMMGSGIIFRDDTPHHKIGINKQPKIGKQKKNKKSKKLKSLYKKRSSIETENPQDEDSSTTNNISSVDQKDMDIEFSTSELKPNNGDSTDISHEQQKTSESVENREPKEDWETDIDSNEETSGIKAEFNKPKKEKKHREFGYEDDLMSMLVEAMLGDSMNEKKTKTKNKIKNKTKKVFSSDNLPSEPEPVNDPSSAPSSTIRSDKREQQTSDLENKEVHRIVDSNGNILKIGDRVKTSTSFRGTVAYLGPVHYTKGDFAGLIVEDVSAGKNNGVIKGKEYFKCPAGRGLMMKSSEVTRIQNK